jgi:hypothetical protein
MIDEDPTLESSMKLIETNLANDNDLFRSLLSMELMLMMP